MKAYSEDLRKKRIVEAVGRGMPKSQAARAFGVGISSVKRYVATYREGRSLAPKKRPGSEPEPDGSAGKLPEADPEERPTTATLPQRLPQRREFLRRVVGAEVGDPTVCRMLGRMGRTRKKGRWERRNATGG